MKNIVICGGGIIGGSIAYHLAKKNIKCTVIERTCVACGASGKAGGFLAKDWSDGTELQELSRKSFDLHMKLMEEFPDSCDYRKLDALSISVKEENTQKDDPKIPEWIDGPVAKCSVIGKKSTCAQVNPFKLTNLFIEKAKKIAGSEIKIGEVNGLEINNGKISGVKVGAELIAADVVVIAMGPWSERASEWIKIPSINSRRAHSIVMKPKKDVTAHALFTEFSTGRFRSRSPEVYPRPDGTVYTCGMTDKFPLPDDPKDVAPDIKSCDSLKHMCDNISSNLADAEVKVQQACYLPLSSSGVPIIGKLPDVEGAYIATGHSFWGILNAPITGAAMAELIVDEHCSVVDLSPFDPTRFII